MKQSSDKGVQGLPQSAKDQDNQRDPGKIRAISDQVERTKISDKELKQRLPDQPGAEMR